MHGSRTLDISQVRKIKINQRSEEETGKQNPKIPENPLQKVLNPEKHRFPRGREAYLAAETCQERYKRRYGRREEQNERRGRTLRRS